MRWDLGEGLIMFFYIQLHGLGVQLFKMVSNCDYHFMILVTLIVSAILTASPLVYGV